jgi:predicted RNA-binding protein YlqC (UPF0109 family)
MANFFSRLFGGSEPKPAAPPSEPAPVAAKPAPTPAATVAAAAPTALSPAAAAQAADLVAFVDYVVRSLVNQTNDVKITSEVDAQGLLIRIHCHQEEVGRIIGKSGKTIRAIRSLVKGAAARQNQKASVIVMEG